MKYSNRNIPIVGSPVVASASLSTRGPSRRRWSWVTAAVLASALVVLPGLLWAGEETAAVERRLADWARYLASDELEGRGVETKGLDLAAEYIAAQCAESGLKTSLFEGSPFQPFKVTTSAKLGKNNRLVLVGSPQEDGQPERIELKLGDDFSPLSMSASGEVDLPLVFVGYGITGKAEEYDDYAGIDVAGKAVVILRHEPQQDDPDSVFNGTRGSPHAPFARKVSNAFEHEVAAAAFCTDEFEIRRNVARARKRWQEALDRLAEEHAKFKEIKGPALEEIETQRQQIEKLTAEVASLGEKLQAEYDPVLPMSAGGGGGQGRDFPVIHCRRSVVDRVVKAALDTDLAALEHQIDEGLTPQSRPFTGWRITGQVEVERTEAEVKNVVAVLPGEGPLAEETLVIGAHYDHLGWGGRGSRARDQKAIHNGADDNASGVAVMIEVARALARRDQPLRRRVVFIAFTAEESGLLGSNHYARNPPFPNDKTIAMLNLDMVGRLRDDKLIVGGTGTGKRFSELLDQLNGRHGFQLTKNPGGYGPSDHTSFYSQKIPVMHYFTGTHEQYHRPTDDFDTLNLSGMRRIAALVTDVAVALADADDRPQYVAISRQRGRKAGDRPFFGSIPDLAHQGPGLAISGVSEGGPAERAGLRGGDTIIRFGESKIDNLEDFDGALRKHKGGDKVQVVVLREGEEKTFEVTLERPR